MAQDFRITRSGVEETGLSVGGKGKNPAAVVDAVREALRGTGFDGAGPDPFGTSAASAAATPAALLVARQATASIATEATLGAVEDFLRQLAEDVGVAPGNYKALRSRVLELQHSGALGTAWNGWAPPLADALALPTVPRLGHLEPFLKAIRDLTARTRATVGTDAETFRAAAAAMEKAEAAANQIRAALDAETARLTAETTRQGVRTSEAARSPRAALEAVRAMTENGQTAEARLVHRTVAGLLEELAERDREDRGSSAGP